MADPANLPERPDDSVRHSPGPGQGSFVGFEQVVEQWQFQSPLMPPMVMRQYSELVPDFAERYVSAWESQTQHRQSLERTAVATQSTTQLRGQKYTLILGIVVVVAAVVLGVVGQPWPAVAVIGMDFIGLGSVFVFSRVQDSRDLERKAQQVPETPPNPPDQAQLPKGRPTQPRPKQSNRGRRGKR